MTSKEALITGAGKRIGRAIALHLASHHYHTIIHYNRSKHEATSLCREITENGGSAEIVQADLSNQQDIEKLTNFIAKHGKKLDLLINNASTYHRCELNQVTSKKWDDDYRINCRSPFELMQAFYKNCTGSIINLLDQRIDVIDAGAGSYGLAKKTLRDITLAAAVDWAPKVRVNAVAPGYIIPPPGVAMEKMYPLLEKVPMKTHSTPEEIASACHFLATTATLTGQIIYLDGGLHLTGKA